MKDEPDDSDLSFILSRGRKGTMMSPWKAPKGIVLALLLSAAWGCGNGGRVKVAGVVTLEGVPIDGATVAFYTKDETGRSATGLADEDGYFRLSTQSEDGAFPCEYKVVVTKFDGPKQKGPKARNSLLPAIYGS